MSLIQIDIKIQIGKKECFILFLFLEFVILCTCLWQALGPFIRVAKNEIMEEHMLFSYFAC